MLLSNETCCLWHNWNCWPQQSTSESPSRTHPWFGLSISTGTQNSAHWQRGEVEQRWPAIWLPRDDAALITVLSAAGLSK